MPSSQAAGALQGGRVGRGAGEGSAGDLWTCDYACSPPWGLSGEGEGGTCLPTLCGVIEQEMLRVSPELGVQGSGPCPTGPPGLTVPFPGAVSLLSYRSLRGCSTAGKGLAHSGCPQAVAEPALCQFLGGPRPPGTVSALMTLSAELLTLGIYRNQAQKRHLEAHKYCRMEVGLCQHYLEQCHSPGTLCAHACSGGGGWGAVGPCRTPGFFSAP